MIFKGWGGGVGFGPTVPSLDPCIPHSLMKLSGSAHALDLREMIPKLKRTQSIISLNWDQAQFGPYELMDISLQSYHFKNLYKNIFLCVVMQPDITI